MSSFNLVVVVLSLSICLSILPYQISAQLKRDYYADICPNVESIVQGIVKTQFQRSSAVIPATLRLFFHDCFVEGCDASVIIASAGSNTAEKDHPDNLSLAGDGFDTVVKAKAAVDAIPACKNKVSCADILAMATRDVVMLAGGPWYNVELGRLDGLSSGASSVDGKLPQPSFNLNQLKSLFSTNGLTQSDMIALSGAHTLGSSHCKSFSNRIYNFSPKTPVDPTLNKLYGAQLQAMCPINVDPSISIPMDPISPNVFDNMYYKNLEQGKGLFTSDQVLFTDLRSKPMVKMMARSQPAFHNAFVAAITKMGRIRVKTGNNGNIRQDCTALNTPTKIDMTIPLKQKTMFLV